MFDVDGFVQECRAALADARPHAAVRELVRGAVTDRTVGQVLSPERVVFDVLHRSPELTVLHIVLPPNMSSAPHDHLMWAVVGVIEGQEDNTFFRQAEPALATSGGREIQAGETLAMGDDTIHAIRNPRDRHLSAIHVYGGDLIGAPRRQWDSDGRSPQPYDHDAFVARLTGG